MKKSFVKSSFFNVGYKVLNVLFPLLTSMYVSRSIGAEGTGRVAYAQNILSYFLVFASIGIPTYGIKEIAKNSTDREKASKSFSELFVINSFTTTICIVLYIISVSTIASFQADFFVFLAVGVNLFLNYFNIDWFYAGIEEYVYITIRSTIVKILSLICLFVFVHNRDDVVKYALVSSAGVSANYLLNIINVKKRVTFSLHNLELKRHLKPVVILLLTMLATDLYNQIDITMMGSVCSKAEIGYYSYAIKLIRIVTSITTAVSATMLPRLSQFYKNKEDIEFGNFTRRVLNAVILLAIPCAVGVVLCSNDIILVLYGEEFIETVPLVLILSPIIIIISISYLCGSIVLTAINKEKYLLYATFAGACLNILLNYVLIPSFRGKGAAIASVIAELIVFILHIMFSKKYVQYHFINLENVKCMIAAMVMAGAVLAIKTVVLQPVINLIVSVCIGGVVYFVALFICRHRLFLDGFKLLTDMIKRTNQ